MVATGFRYVKRAGGALGLAGRVCVRGLGSVELGLLDHPFDDLFREVLFVTGRRLLFLVDLDPRRLPRGPVTRRRAQSESAAT